MDKSLSLMMDGDCKLSKLPTIIHIAVGLLPTYSLISMRIQQTLGLGANIQIWDLAEMIGLPPTEHQHNTNLIVSIKNKHQLYELIKSNQYALFVTAINPEKRFFWTYYYLAKFHCKHTKVANGWIAEYGNSNSVFIAKSRHLLKYFLLTLLNKLNVLSLPKTIFLPGYYWNDKIPGNPQIINVNHLLYDQFLDSHHKNLLHQDKYILFLDEAHTHHPDWLIWDLQVINDEIYHKKMRLFFNKLEKEFQLPIIIAAHPKAKYQGDEFGEGIFGKRKIIKGKTNELAEDAAIFIAHFSTTRILPIIYKKPLYLVWLDDFSTYPPILKNDIYGFHKETGCPILEEEDIYRSFSHFLPDIEKYQNFLQKYYVAKGFEQTNTLDMIGEELIKKAEND